MYVKNLVGVDHIALGSDYDGTVSVPFDTTGTIYITESLLQAGLTHDEISMYNLLIIYLKIIFILII